MEMREELQRLFQRWRAAAPGQQQEPFLALLLALVALGILCAERLRPPVPLFALLCACALLLGAFLVWRRRPLAWLALSVLFFALGGLRFLAADALPAADVSRLAGQEVCVEGALRAAPVLRTDAQGVRHVRYEVAAVSVQAANVTTGSWDSVLSITGALYIGPNMSGCRTIDPTKPPPSPVTTRRRPPRGTAARRVGCTCPVTTSARPYWGTRRGTCFTRWVGRRSSRGWRHMAHTSGMRLSMRDMR